LLDGESPKKMLPDDCVADLGMSKLLVLSRREATRYRGAAPYVVISIRSPGEPVPRLRADPLRMARINIAIYDTTPEWEAVGSNPVAAMTTANAERIAAFVARYWGRIVSRGVVYE
jgi:hypothetical protein